MAGNRRRPGDGPSARMVWTGIVGVLLGTATFGGYIIWSHVSAQQAAVVAPGDPDLDKPTAQECAIARAVLAAVHASANDAAWRTAAGFKTSSLRARSEVVNPVDTPGFTDDEADDLRAKAGAGALAWASSCSPSAGVPSPPMKTSPKSASAARA